MKHIVMFNCKEITVDIILMDDKKLSKRGVDSILTEFRHDFLCNQAVMNNGIQSEYTLYLKTAIECACHSDVDEAVSIGVTYKDGKSDNIWLNDWRNKK